MAKGKGKGGASSGPHKKHGPKRHLFKEFKPMVKAYADAGLLSKYYNYESWSQACAAKGKRNATRSDFNSFVNLPMEEKKKYFESMMK